MFQLEIILYLFPVTNCLVPHAPLPVMGAEPVSVWSVVRAAAHRGCQNVGIEPLLR